MEAFSADLMPNEDDLGFEEELLRNPFSLKTWLRYLNQNRDAPPKKRNLLYERALKELPGSYKLWFAYLRERRARVLAKRVDDPSWESLNNTYERALVFMHKMPRIWMDYCQLLMDQRKITRTRITLDRALQALPATQHERIWKLYQRFLKQDGVPHETAVRVWRRYLKIEPDQVEEFVDFLVSIGRLDEAARRLAGAVNRDDFVSLRGKSKHKLWTELCDLISTHPLEVKSLAKKVEPIIRDGLVKFSDETGRLWTALADYYIRLAHFEKARDIFEEGISTVNTVRDFSLIFEAYAKYEESMIAAKMAQAGDEDAAAEDDDMDPDAADLELRLARLENLMDRHPELLSSVLLRQNPHNVYEWHKRVKLFQKQAQLERVIYTFAEAVKTVDPLKATGKPHTLWVAFARFYEEHEDYDNARVIFEKAVQVNYKNVDDLASVWCEYAEFELRLNEFDKALELMQRATVQPKPKVLQDKEQMALVRNQVYKSVKLWTFYVDLEESLGTMASAEAVYERILDLRIATPQIIINFATMLEENKFFEKAFKAYERGVNLFNYPHVYEIWVAYLTKFVARFGGKKLERARDLFEQAVEKVPADKAKALYLMYAKLEEEHGLIRHAMLVYDRAARAVRAEDRLEVYSIYIARAAEFFGVTHTREIYERAIETLPDADAKGMCIKYAEVERRLGEIDRARGIYQHASQFADPRVDAAFWQLWHDFEVRHGNEDTFKEMLRIKRSVQMRFTQVGLMTLDVEAAAKAAGAAAIAAAGAGGAAGAATGRRIETQMEALEREATATLDADQAREAAVSAKAAAADQANPEEIDIGTGEEEEDEDGPVDDTEIEQKAVPAAVFGDALAKSKGEAEGPAGGARAREEDEGEAMGALERFKKKRKV